MAVGVLKSNARGLRPYGKSMPTLRGRVPASQTFITGAILIRSSGNLIEASADPVADIVGVAAEDITSSADNDLVRYWPVVPGALFEATLEDQTNEDHALVEANIFTDYALQVDTDGNWYVDENDTTNTAVMVIAPVLDSDITSATKRARVIVTFLSDILAVQT